jgi:pilus assembly protein CpaC
VKARAGVTLAFFSALTFVFSATAALRAQTSAPAPQPASMTSQDSANELSIAVGKSVVLDLARPVTRIVVGLGDFAQASAISPTQVLVNGKAPGETSLIMWDTSGGRQFFNVSVRASSFVANDRLDAIRRELRTELPGQSLKITQEGGNIFLRGTVTDLTSSDRAVLIASTAGKVVNLLNVNVPVNEPQILLKVRFASVDRSKSRQLGLNLFSTGFGNTIGGINTSQFSPPSVTVPSAGNSATTTLSNELNLFAFYPGMNLGATIEAMESKGLVQVLAEPNLLAKNGKQASFLAGGEYPYPVAQSSGTGGTAPITIMFKQYGVLLNFIPTITPRGSIRLQVAPEVSALDFTNAVEVSGFTIPAISVRRVKTEVELQDGQSFAIGGLLDNRDTETYDKIPFLGDIPILGKFFQSIQRTKTNTELIVIVTPEIVAPIPAGAPLPALKYPEKFLPPNSNVPMYTPDAKTAESTPPPAPTSIPVEKLLDSMKPETPLVVEGSMTPGSSSGGGGGGGGGASAGTSTGP